MIGDGRLRRRDDPARAHLHEYWLVDAATGEVLAGFASAAAATAWMGRHLDRLRGTAMLLCVVHPDGCACPEAPPVDGSGQLRRPPRGAPRPRDRRGRPVPRRCSTCDHPQREKLEESVRRLRREVPGMRVEAAR